MDKDPFKTAKLPIFSTNNNYIDGSDSGINIPEVVNATIEALTDPFSKNEIMYMTQRPSFVISSTITNSTTWYHHAHYPYICLGSTIYKQSYGGGQTTVWTGTNASTENGSKFTDLDSSTGYVLGFVEGGTGKFLTINIGTDTPTVHTGAPSVMNPHIAYLNGYVFANTLGTRDIYNSDIDDPSTWNLGVNFITASASPEVISGLVSYRNYVVAFKETSCEFFYDAGLSGTSPLQRNENLALGVGCPFPWSISKAGDSLFWVGKDSISNTHSIYQLTGEQLNKISTPFIERMLRRISDGTSVELLSRYPANGGTVTLFGKTYYVLNIGRLNTFAYCLDTKQWASWYNWSNSGIIWDFAKSITALGVPTFYFYSSLTGTVSFAAFTSNQKSYDTINGVNVPVVVSITTPPVDFGTSKRKTISSMRWLGTILSGYNVRCYWSDDNQYTSSSNHVFPIGTNPTIRNLGQFRRREFTFEFANVQDINTPNTLSSTLLPRIRMEGIEVEYREGTS